MRLFIALIAVFSFAIPTSAERITLTDVTDNNTNQLFSALAKYQNQPHTSDELKATWNAIHAFLGILSSTIKTLPNFRGIFTGNCTVYFEDQIDSANCELEATNPRGSKSNSTFVSGHRLAREYLQQIRSNHILLASIYADWRRGKVEKFNTDLYFKQRTCTGSLSQSEPESLTAEATKSLSPDESVSQSESASLNPTYSVDPSASDTTYSVTRPPTPSSNPSLSATTTQSISQIPTLSWEPLNLEFAIWNRTTGVYADSSKQASRFTSQDGVVTDSYTGLQWQASISMDTYNWSFHRTQRTE